MKPAFDTFAAIRRLTLGLLLTVPFTASAVGPSTPDLVVSASTDSSGAAFLGSKDDWTFTITSVGFDVAATFPTGSVVFKVDFPPNTTIDSISGVNGSLYSGGMNCTYASSTVTCLSVDNFTLIGNNSEVQFSFAGVSPGDAGTFTVPHPPGVCKVNPDSIVGETDYLNNSCGPISIEVSEPPAITTTRWMGVNMWDNVVRIYDQAINSHVNAVPFNMPLGAEIHAIDDIARNPVTGVYYVFPRLYQSNTHRLATFDPVTGISDIADTGLSFHDSAFDETGTLYAVGRNSNLYTLDLANGTPTQLCSTPYGSNTGNHSALAWDSDTDELLQIVDGTIDVIDLQNLPANPDDPCVVTTTTQISGQADSAMFAAVFDDGNLYVADYSSNLFLLGRNGAVLQLGELPMVMHSLVPDPGTLPLKPAPCLADAYLIQENDGFGSTADLFAVNSADASISWVSTLSNKPGSMDYNAASGLLVTTRRVTPANTTIIEQYNPCTGELVSSAQLTSDPANYVALDIPGPDRAYLFGFVYDPFEYRLSSLDLDGLATTVLPGAVPFSPTLAIVGDTVFLAPSTNDETSELTRYSLSNWNQQNEALALVYGPGLESSGYRRIESVDPIGGTGELLATVLRAPSSGGSNSTTLMPSKLARIDANGNVIVIGSLPTTATILTSTSQLLFKDGFEANAD